MAKQELSSTSQFQHRHYLFFSILLLVLIGFFYSHKSDNSSTTISELDDISDIIGQNTELSSESYFGQSQDHSSLKNPKLSWFETLFCQGYQTSRNCPRRDLHPLINYLEETDNTNYRDSLAEKNPEALVDRSPGKTRTNAKNDSIWFR